LKSARLIAALALVLTLAGGASRPGTLLAGETMGSAGTV
jgi:hypothetical protein